MSDFAREPPPQREDDDRGEETDGREKMSPEAPMSLGGARALIAALACLLWLTGCESFTKSIESFNLAPDATPEGSSFVMLLPALLPLGLVLRRARTTR